MASAKIQGSQRDFSSGELDVSMKRADENPIMKTGARQLSNWRILNSRSVQNRPGRSALFPETGRCDEILMSPGNKFKLVFTAAGRLRVYDSAGTRVFDQSGFPWTGATIQSVVWAIYQTTVYITFPGMQPQVLSWDGVSTWTESAYTESVTPGGQKRTAFYRIAPKGITMAVSDVSGAVTVTLGAGYFAAGMVGTRVRYINRQILLTGFTDPTTMSGTVEEVLPGGQQLAFGANDPSTVFNLGDQVLGSISGAQGYVVGYTSSTSMLVQLMSAAASALQSPAAPDPSTGNVTQTASFGFLATDILSGPAGSLALSAASLATFAPEPVPFWDQEVMNSFQGWPAGCFVDQNRLGFCNFPSVPSGIAWSAIGAPLDLYPDAFPDSAIYELAPSKSQVLFVVPGPESGEFIFCDNKCYYIPITVTNPLIPGGIGFNILSSDGAAPVQPCAVEEIIFYVTAGGRRVKAVIAPGAYYRPFNTVDVSENHDHLFGQIIGLAAPTADGTFPERYCYALNSGGAVVVGKYQVKDGQLLGSVGWLPWSGRGTVGWVSALLGDVLFTSTYSPNGITPVSIVEILDDTQYLDGALLVNSLPAPFAPPGGKGPLFVFPGPGGAVTLMDQSTRMMGVYQIDANGFIVPQNNGGENLAIASLVAGHDWTAILEPFVPDAPSGPDRSQRMFKRRVTRMATYVINSTGFAMGWLFAGPITPVSPALGTLLGERRFTAWNQGDDPTKPPPLRESAERCRPVGRYYDPRVVVIKDTPGPLIVAEVGLEVSI